MVYWARRRMVRRLISRKGDLKMRKLKFVSLDDNARLCQLGN